MTMWLLHWLGFGQVVYIGSHEVIANKLLCTNHICSSKIGLGVGKWPRSQRGRVTNENGTSDWVPMQSSGSHIGFHARGPQPWGRR